MSLKSSTKESMAISTGKKTRILGKPMYEGKNGGFSKDTVKKCPTIKDLRERKYPFPNSYLSRMLDDLLEKRGY